MPVMLALALALPLAVSAASDPSRITGDYVEARTAQVFAGGCILGSEGETSGREAIMGWRVSHGSLNGARLDGLSVVAAVAADMNLGIHELGGPKPTTLKTVIIVDNRANARQRDALVAMVKQLATEAIGGEVEITSAPITFTRDDESVRLAAGDATVDVKTNVEHTPACAAIKWFEPLAKTDQAEIGITRVSEWKGNALRGARWRDVSDDKKSSFVGTFAIPAK
jgi:hypothetical protein